MYEPAFKAASFAWRLQIIGKDKSFAQWSTLTAKEINVEVSIATVFNTGY